MIRQLKAYGKYHETLFLGILSIMCFGLSIFRLLYSGTRMFLFLNWNLFLAFLPWFFSTILIVYPKLQRNILILLILVCSWLVFFPNAPYILTDLFHLGRSASMPIWYDLVLILSFAWTGLMFGFLSLWDIEKIAGQFFHKAFVPLVSISLLFLGSFGIYLGRYLRWNSWDIIKKPFELIYDIGDRIINPFSHPRTWGMTLFMFVFLNMVYWSLRFIRKRG